MGTYVDVESKEHIACIYAGMISLIMCLLSMLFKLHVYISVSTLAPAVFVWIYSITRIVIRHVFGQVDD